MLSTRLPSWISFLLYLVFRYGNVAAWQQSSYQKFYPRHHWPDYHYDDREQKRGRTFASASRLTQYAASSGNSGSQQDDPVLKLPLMEAELATMMMDASSSNDGADNDTIAKSSEELKSAISQAKIAAEFGIRRAQSEFYDAFSNGDIDAMDKIWSVESPVRCVHPGMSSLEGREAVMASWKQIFSSSGGGGSAGGGFEIEPARAQIEICGITAICSCVEKTEGGGQLEALNIYKREAGSWKMTLHMAGPVVMQRGGGAVF